MSASTLSSEAGRRLRAVRMRAQLSVREVERLSRLLAEEKKSQDYYISHAWLTEIENGAFTPSIYKLYSLSVIYKYGLDQILGCFGIHLGDITNEQLRMPLPHTHVVGGQSRTSTGPLEIPPEFRDKFPLEKTDLVSRMFQHLGGLPASLRSRKDSLNSVYGYVGTEDFRLFPLIRPGSFVEIDTNQKKVDQRNWSNLFDRPIYFVELRDSYACSWCELREGRLLLIPYPRPESQVQSLRFPTDAGIVGRVTAVSMRIAEMQLKA